CPAAFPLEPPQWLYPTPCSGACPAPAKVALRRDPSGCRPCRRARVARGVAHQHPGCGGAGGGGCWGGRGRRDGAKSALNFLSAVEGEAGYAREVIPDDRVLRKVGQCHSSVLPTETLSCDGQPEG